MAGAADPVNPVNPVNPAQTAEARTPGLVMFAAIMMFLLGGFQLMYAILEFARATWVAVTVEGTVGGPLWLWGIVDVLFAAILFYAGYDILRGGSTGRMIGIIIAGLSALRWFFYIPAAPWAAAIAIVIDVLIIYGLVAHEEFFRRTPITAP